MYAEAKPEAPCNTDRSDSSYLTRGVLFADNSARPRLQTQAFVHANCLTTSKRSDTQLVSSSRSVRNDRSEGDRFLQERSASTLASRTAALLSHVASTAEGAERCWETSFVRDASGGASAKSSHKESGHHTCAESLEENAHVAALACASGNEPN
jgi:hypothetical protein